MQIKKYIFFVVFSGFLFLSAAQASEVKFYYNDDISSPQALKNLDSFIVFPRFPASSPSESTSIIQIVLQELKKIGKVDQKPFVVKTPSGNDALTYTNFPQTDGSMIYEISQLIDAQAKELPIVKASIKIICETNIKKTHEIASCIVWSRTYFFSGSVRSDLKSLVKKSLASLLENFSISYREINTRKSDGIQFYLLNLDSN